MPACVRKCTTREAGGNAPGRVTVYVTIVRVFVCLWLDGCPLCTVLPTAQAVSAGDGAHPSANPGLNRWFGVLRQLSLPADSDGACAVLLGHISEIETALGAFLATVNKYAALAAEMATVVTDMHVR